MNQHPNHQFFCYRCLIALFVLLLYVPTILGQGSTQKADNELSTENRIFFCQKYFRVFSKEISFGDDVQQVVLSGELLFQNTYIDLQASSVTLNAKEDGFLLRSNPTYNQELRISIFSANQPEAEPLSCYDKKQILRQSAENIFATAKFIEWDQQATQINISLVGNTKLELASSNITLTGQRIEVTLSAAGQILQILSNEPLVIKPSSNASLTANKALLLSQKETLYLVGDVKIFYMGKLVVKSQKITLRTGSNPYFLGEKVHTYSPF